MDDIRHALTLSVNLRSIRFRMTEEALNAIPFCNRILLNLVIKFL